MTRHCLFVVGVGVVAVQQVVKRRCLFAGGVGVVAVQQVVKRRCLFAGGVGVVSVQLVVKRHCLCARVAVAQQGVKRLWILAQSAIYCAAAGHPSATRAF